MLRDAERDCREGAKGINTGMGARFVRVDHDTQLLLPPDMRQWVPKDHLVHFIMDGVEQLELRSARVNERGTGDEQYPPTMMLGLLVYSYASGVFSSRVIERMTYENVAVRVLCADTHPDQGDRRVACQGGGC